MSRKVLLAAMAIAVPIALLIAIGSGVASGKTKALHDPPPPVAFTGNVSCNLQGKITISPAAFNGIGYTWTITFTGTNSACVGLLGTILTQPNVAGAPETLKKSIDSFSYTVSAPASGPPGALCNDLEYGGSLPLSGFSGTITWLGTSPISPTTVSYPAGSSMTMLPGVIALMGGLTTATSSFPGTVDILLGYSVATVFTDCASTTGLSTLPVGHLGGDNLLVGSAF